MRDIEREAVAFVKKRMGQPITESMVCLMGAYLESIINEKEFKER